VALRVIFFGNSESVFSNRHFQALWEAPCQVAGAVDVPPTRRASTNTRPLSGVPTWVEMARRQGIPAFEPTSPNLPEFVQTISDLKPDLFLAVGYTNLLKEAILSVPRILSANFHASLLPAYRGKHPVFWALRNGERWSGLTVHVMDSGLDTGDILYQVRVQTRKRDTVASLYDRIMDRSVNLVARLIRDAEQGKLRRTAQSEAGASYYSSVSAEDFRLDWSHHAEQLRRWIQTSPGQCFCDIAARRVFLQDADTETVPAAESVSPGMLIRIGRTSCTVAAGKDALRLRWVRLDQQNEKSMPQLCREFGLEQGDLLY
jgi:methionyl-tRNA formyltransferase